MDYRLRNGKAWSATARIWGCLLLLGCGLSLGGCQVNPVKRTFDNPYKPESWTIAVVPFVDQSGSGYLNPLAVTEEFFTELQQIEGLQVMSVNQVLSALAQMQIDQVRSPADITLLAEILKVDAVVVGAITIYDPYDPPKIGMVVQIYDRRSWNRGKVDNSIDPGKIARSGRPFELKPADIIRPTVMISRIFDANDKKIIQLMKDYAVKYREEKNPWSWEKFKTSRNYLRFVSRQVIGELLYLQKDYIEKNSPSAAVDINEGI